MTDIQHNNVPPGAGWQTVYIKKSRGAGFWIAIGFALFFFLCALLFFVLFIGSLVLNKSFITGAVVKAEKHVDETILEENGENKVAIISIKGILSNESAEGFFLEKPSIVDVVKQQLEYAADDNQVKAVLLEIDSPGGGITASDIIYHQITKFKTGTQKKVVVYMQDVAASGGYYISTAADAIVAHPTTITGSIGVIMPLINVAELINRYGIKDNSIASGNLKEIGSPLKQMTADEADVLKGIINEMYLQFVQVVSTGRNLDIEAVKKIADGRIYTGKQALENGLIDQLGYPEDAIAMTKKIAGLTEATVVRYKKHYGLTDLFGLMSKKLFQQNTIKLDISHLRDRNDTKPMYLWNGYSGNE
ncbi:putative signal peptide peptidase SppA [Candidatus Brocadiaceae bacterium B188]|nr:signal peptide peptidase SppA [Candidatus Brocadia sapporoensis]QQR68003.1 MAG: signal peptide peptidase SppA [Candidatus Brocadia sp.]RZV58110.1 MAG: signal peptide peptidase SppA [Candidatus Brocadia sp. BROELEC01]TWU52869.1 putative signal peptide peptidase SppA [Candidatus Brocadiaceae bacterium B188]